MELSGAQWRKSSLSTGNGTGDGDACVEVAFLADGAVGVRDTKDRSRTPHVFTAHEWACFVAGVRAGEFDRS